MTPPAVRSQVPREGFGKDLLVAAGTNLALAIVLFGEVFSPLPILCMAASLMVTGYFAFRWLQKAIF
ncbi:MAG TPA: hypothetical protein VKK31_29190 [Thermoanaerobaculia bacterium]|nr:hypothetical protein [Thermoanaerobaculia bacterium]